MNDRKVAHETVKEFLEPWGFGNVEAYCEAERYPGTPLLDTRVQVTVQPFSITWEDRNKLVKELAEVVKKYAI